jgi:hypothetical protein
VIRRCVAYELPNLIPNRGRIGFKLGPAALLFLRPGFQKGFLNVRSPSVAADIPPAITTSDSVETRLGTLKFFDRFPDDATVQKVYEQPRFSARCH